MADLVKLLAKEPFTKFSRRYLRLVSRKELTPGELVLLLVVADKTVSWRRLWLQASYADLSELTGMTRKGLVAVIDRLVQTDLLVRKPFGQSYSYALVPDGMTGAQVLAVCDVDNVELPVTSGNSCLLPEVTASADLSYIDSKKGLRKASPSVDRGMRSRARSSCSTCHGEGWVVIVAADGYSESVAPCPCTSSSSSETL